MTNLFSPKYHVITIRYYHCTTILPNTFNKRGKKKHTGRENRESDESTAVCDVIRLQYFLLSIKQTRRRTEMKVNNEQENRRDTVWRGIRTAVAQNQAGVRYR